MALNIVGMHDREGTTLVPGWCLVTEELGLDNDRGGDYRGIVAPIVRLNHRYSPQGTIPRREHYARFAEVCAGYVKNSQNCRHWIIGNETNLRHEWPDGVMITAQDYAECFTLCRNAIKALTPDAVVIPAPVGPWNVEAKYPLNPTGDWLLYQAQVLEAVQCDGVAIHSYGEFGDVWMGAPYQNRHYGFRAYRDLIGAIPSGKMNLPVFLTECNPNRVWSGFWMQDAVEEINAWNQQGNQQVVCVLPYCYVNRDAYGFRDKGDVLADIRAAYDKGYTPKEMTFRPGAWPHFTREKFAEYVKELDWTSKPTRLFLHHTAVPTPETWKGMATMDAMYAYYRQQIWYDDAGRKQVGWTVFPHIFVAQDGIWLMNDLRKDGAGVVGQNRGSIHVEMVLNGDVSLPNGEMWENCKIVLRTLLETLGIPALEYHRDFAAKTCPGIKVTKTWVTNQLFPSQGLPENEPSMNPAIIAEKCRWWQEEVQRMIEAGNLQAASRMNKSLIVLLYRLEKILKA
ncbi:MAG: peptidoglycan recognition family protein [Dehalococcoidia bacterium]|jgi:hypothetical protein